MKTTLIFSGLQFRDKPARNVSFSACFRQMQNACLCATNFSREGNVLLRWWALSMLLALGLKLEVLDQQDIITVLVVDQLIKRMPCQ